jgi:hypothetical protein
MFIVLGSKQRHNSVSTFKVISISYPTRNITWRQQQGLVAGGLEALLVAWGGCGYPGASQFALGIGCQFLVLTSQNCHL